ncbi:hypothetical protein KAI87_03805 [Myxococcota bacterium]|nr:hypothetical protein [Myxococcota bacterium]
MPGIKDSPILVRDMQQTTSLKVEDNGDGKLGAGDKVTDAKGQSVSLSEARQEHFVGRATKETQAWSDSFRTQSSVPRGMTPPSKQSIMKRAAEMKEVVSGKAGDVTPERESRALQARGQLLGMLGTEYGDTNFFGIPDDETQANLIGSIQNIIASANADPSNDMAWAIYGLAIVSALDQVPGMFRSTVEEKMGLTFEGALTEASEGIASSDKLHSKFALSAVLLGASKNDSDLSAKLDPGGTKLKAVISDLKTAHKKDPEAFGAAFGETIQGPSAEVFKKLILENL